MKSFKTFFTEDKNYGQYFREKKEGCEVEIKKTLSALDPGKIVLKYRDITIIYHGHFQERRAFCKDRNFLNDDQICEMILKFIDRLHDHRLIGSSDPDSIELPPENYLVRSKIMHAAIILQGIFGKPKEFYLFNIFPQKSRDKKYYPYHKGKEILIESHEQNYGVSDEFAQYLQFLSNNCIVITEEEKIYDGLPKKVILDEDQEMTLLFCQGKLWDADDALLIEID